MTSNTVEIDDVILKMGQAEAMYALAAAIILSAVSFKPLSKDLEASSLGSSGPYLPEDLHRTPDRAPRRRSAASGSSTLISCRWGLMPT